MGSSPGPITAAGARAAAHTELQKPEYQRARPGLLERGWDHVKHWFSSLFHHAFSGTGSASIVILVIAVAVALVLVFVRLGKLPGRDPERSRGTKTRRRTAQDYRDEADSYSAAGSFAEAVRATTRAMVRELEDRGVLEPVPGSTAAALSAQATAAVPAVGGDAATVAGTFDAIWYAGRPATAGDAASVRAAELRIAAQRLVVA